MADNQELATALKVQQLEGQLQLLQQSQSSSSTVLAKGFADLQNDIRGLAARMEAINSLRGGQEAHGASIERMFKLIMDREDSYREDQTRIQDQFAALVNKTDTDLDGVKSHVHKWSGVGITLGAIATLLITMVLWVGSVFVDSYNQSQRTQSQINRDLLTDFANVDKRLAEEETLNHRNEPIIEDLEHQRLNK